jgi:hypothetical protein
MQIKYTEFAPNPALRNTITHLPPHIAQNLIAQGVAIGIPYKHYSEFLSAEHRTGSDPSNVNPTQISGVEWSCSVLPHDIGRVVIWRKSGGEVARTENEAQAIQMGVPPSVLTRFRELKLAAQGGINYNEVAHAEQAKRDAEEKGGVWKTIFRNA